MLLTPGSHGARLDLLELLLLSTAEMLSPSSPPLLIQMKMLPFMLFPFINFVVCLPGLVVFSPPAQWLMLLFGHVRSGGVGRLAAGILEILNHYLSQ